MTLLKQCCSPVLAGCMQDQLRVATLCSTSAQSLHEGSKWLHAELTQQHLLITYQH